LDDSQTLQVTIIIAANGTRNLPTVIRSAAELDRLAACLNSTPESGLRVCRSFLPFPFFFQPDFHPFPLHLTERTSTSYITTERGREKGSELGQLWILAIEYPLWDENLTPPIINPNITGSSYQS
jgi:hypothetical protein